MNTLALHYPDRGYVRRMAGYLRLMYPLPSRLASAALIYLSLSAVLVRIHGLQLSMFTPFAFLGIWNVFSLGLILRLMDELKDTDIDRQLFAHRPLPVGEVRAADIQRSLSAICVVYLLANMAAGQAFWMSAVVLGYALLMFRYFFMPRLLQRFLLLNLATHNPIVALMLLDIVALFAVEQGLSHSVFLGSDTLLLIGLYWALLFSWEIARKIRAAHEEDAYVTYSRILGRLGAVVLAGGVQTLSFGTGLYFCHRLASVWPFIIVAGAGYVNLMAEYLCFLIGRRRTGSNLRRYTEAYITSVWFALLVAMVVCPR